VIATKSTVPIGSGRLIYDTIKRNQQQPTRFDVVANPEFLREGSAVEDFLRPNRIIIGAESDEAVAIMKDLYRPLYLLETPFVVTNMESAEIIKYASNAFLATKVSFINEVAMLCERVGADVQVVAKGMGLDGRIGNKFLHAGPGYGGSCFPKDVRALIATGQQHGCRMAIAEAAAAANDRQQQWVMDKIRAALGSCSGQRIGMLGLSFKPNTSDIRESPALHIARLLLQDGAAVQAFDPAAQEDACRAVPELLACRDAYHAAAGADALILATEWNEFRNLDLGQVKSAMRGCTFIDLRNVYVPTAMGAAGFHYISVGRPACRPSVSV
jgi:UDPglucose 6-dehydrogenase